MLRAVGISSASYLNEQVAPGPPASEHYVAHLFLLPDEPGPAQVTPFLFASIDLCELAPFLRVILNTAPSLHGYARNFHGYNDVAARLHRFSHFLMPCYARNFDREYSEAFGGYLAKVVHIHRRTPLELLNRLAHFEVSPLVVASTRKCFDRARELGIPCAMIASLTSQQLNEHIRACFSAAAEPLKADGKKRLAREGLEEVRPNVLVASCPERFMFGESELMPYPASHLRLLLANEGLSNQMRRRYVPKPPVGPADHSKNVERLVESTLTIFAQRLCDYLLADTESGTADPNLSPSLGVALDQYRKTRSAENYEVFVKEAADHLSEYPGACSYILCCPAINKKGSGRILKRLLPYRLLKFAYKPKAEDYRQYLDRGDFRSNEELEKLMSVMGFQALENDYLSSVLGLYAASYRRPILRTPQLAAALFGRLRQLRDMCGGDRRAFVRDLRKFGDELTNSLPGQVRAFMASSPAVDVKLVSDLPLEWLPVTGVPLMFDHVVSRIPLTPGNALFAQFNECREDIYLGPNEAQRVLIANCFQPTDKLYGYPTLFAEVLKDMGARYCYAEPASVEEYEAALRAHKPYILVHWGHGSYDQELDRGYLHIRDEKTQVWDLRSSSVPPIVLLGACETAAIAETHNTPANGWLALGARSVLATYFPVQADLTVLLFGRMFANLLEALRGDQVVGTWAVVVSKTLSLNRYLDYFCDFAEDCRRRERPVPPGEVFLEYAYLWNRERLSPAEGYRRCPELLARAMDRFGKDLGDYFREYLRTERTVPHTMFFCHLGAPETILIRRDQARSTPEGNAALTYWEQRSADPT